MTLFDKGTYRARAVAGSAMLGYSGNKRTEQVAVALRFADGPYEGQTVGWYGYFTEKTEKRTLESLVYLGLPGNDMMRLHEIGSEGSPDVEIVIDHEENDRGETRHRVQWINRIGVGMKDRMNDEQQRAFATRMKGKLISLGSQAAATKSNGGVGAQRPPASRNDAPPAHTDDDIPF